MSRYSFLKYCARWNGNDRSNRQKMFHITLCCSAEGKFCEATGQVTIGTAKHLCSLHDCNLLANKLNLFGWQRLVIYQTYTKH